MTFQASGQNFTTSPASAPVTIAPRSSVSVPLSIALPRAAGDAPESVQFTEPNGLESSVPIARRSLIPSRGGFFSATLTSSVSRGPGQIKTFYVDVPAGQRDLDVSLFAPDHATDDPVYYYLFSPADLASTGPESRVLCPRHRRHADVRQPDRKRLADHPPSPARSVGDRRDAGPDDRRDGVLPERHRVRGVQPARARLRDRSPDLDVDEHRVGLERPDHGVGQEHDQPRRVLRTATVGQRHHWRQYHHAGRAGARSRGTLTATLSPTAAAGTAVNGTLSVVDSTDYAAIEPAIGFPASISDFHDFAYAYTVGAGSSG